MHTTIRLAVNTLRRGLVLLPLVAAGCAQDEGFGAVMLHDGGPEARLSEAYVGQPVSEAIQRMQDPPTIRKRLPDGSELLVWTQANVHRGLGAALTCEETVVAWEGRIQSYDRQGTGCDYDKGDVATR